MLTTEPRRTSISRPPPSVDANTLDRGFWSPGAPSILDVREDEFYRAGHLEGAVHAPDSNTAALVQKVQECDRVVLVCDDGRLSSTVARMLGVCGFPEVAFLKGGLKAWQEAGHSLMEISPSGVERPVRSGGDPDAAGRLGQLLGYLTPPVIIAGILGAAALLGGLALLLSR